LNTRAGLCNGTRLIVRELKNNVIVAHILKGKTLGERVFIPRVDLIPSEDEFPVTIRRRQFPVRLAFAMTINKFQGQTFEKVGIYLPSPVFSHGQLYVAFSRSKSKKNFKIKVEDTERQGKIKANSDRLFTINCVYREILEEQRSLYESRLNNVQNVFPPSHPEQIDIEEDLNSNQNYYSNSNCESESDSVKTQNYLEDLSYQSDLSARALKALKLLIQKDAYDLMDKLSEIWAVSGLQSLADEIIYHIRSFPERIFTNEQQVGNFYLNDLNLV
jgi:hypothetical protein